MGKVETFTLDIHPFSQPKRKVWIYLPDGYEKSMKKYDVLYMFDGHNLFYDDVATYGKSWGMKDYLDYTHAKLVVVGVDCNHRGNNRLSEYCPFKPAQVEVEPLPRIQAKGQITAEWFVKTLKPYVEKHYKVSKDRKHVGIGGSSMGGLMSEYMIMKYNNVFSKAACVSPSTHFCYEDLKKLIRASKVNPETYIYIDQGSQEVHGKRLFIDEMEMMLKMNRLYNIQGAHTFPRLTPGGHHTESDWERVVPYFLDYLYPELFKHIKK